MQGFPLNRSARCLIATRNEGIQQVGRGMQRDLMRLWMHSVHCTDYYRH